MKIIKLLVLLSNFLIFPLFPLVSMESQEEIRIVPFHSLYEKHKNNSSSTLQKLLGYIKNSKRSLYIVNEKPTFDIDFINDLRKLMNNGVRIKLIFGYEGRGSMNLEDIEKLRKESEELKGGKYSGSFEYFQIDNGEKKEDDKIKYKMHNKFIVIDDEQVIVGSPNLSHSSDTNTTETFVEITGNKYLPNIFIQYANNIISFYDKKDINVFSELLFNINSFNNSNSIINLCFSPIQSISDFIKVNIEKKEENNFGKIIDIYPFIAGSPTSSSKTNIFDFLLNMSKNHNNSIKIFSDKLSYINTAVKSNGPLVGLSSGDESPIKVFTAGTTKNLNHQKLMLICDNPRVIIGSAGMTQSVQDDMTFDVMLTIRDTKVFQYFQEANHVKSKYNGLTVDNIK